MLLTRGTKNYSLSSVKNRLTKQFVQITQKITILLFFDTETTAIGKEAEIGQLSAVDNGAENEFLCYILPERDTSKNASKVSKYEHSRINGLDSLSEGYVKACYEHNQERSIHVLYGLNN